MPPLSWLPHHARRALRARTFAARLGIANSLLIVVVCVTLSWVLARRYLDHVSGILVDRGRAISEHLAREAGRSQMQGLQDLEQQARADGGVVYIRFFDTHSLLLVAGGRTPVEASVPAPITGTEVRGPIEVGAEVWEFQAPIFATDLVSRGTPASVVPLLQSEQQEPLGTVAVGLSLKSLGVLRARTLGTAVASSSLFALLAVLVAVQLARAFTRPLGALATAADTVARGDFNVEVDVRTDDEIGRLGRSFNGMVASLRRSATLEAKVHELQEVTRLKSEFLAAVSHELRTPLNVIIGYTEMLSTGAGGTVTAEQSEMLDSIQRYSKLQLALINNVLDYSRLVSGKMSFHVERFALAPLLDEILAMHRGRLRSRKVRLTASVDADLPTLETDRIKLHEIVRNLVDNAVKFAEAGMVAVKAWPIEGGESVAIEVADTGPGMAPVDLQTIFDAFQQVGQGSTRPTGGVGLGLSIVKQLVDALGGRVDVTSRLGEGSTFHVEIPRRLPGDHPVAEPPAAPEGARKGEARRSGRRLRSAVAARG
jgi:signal transduction histidine kinase